MATKPITKRFIISYALAYFGMWAALLAPVMLGLAIRVAELDPQGKAGSLSLVLAPGALLALISNPIFGRLSDRTKSRLGRRRPWIIGGALVGTLGIVWCALAQDVIMLTIAWSFTQIAYNAAVAAVAAVLADQVPAKQRGSVSAAINVGGAIGVAAGLGLANLGAAVFQSSFLMFTIPASVGLVLVLFFAITLHDPRVTKRETTPYSLRTFFGSIVFNPLKSPDYAKMLTSQFLFFVGISLLSSYQIYFMIDTLKVPSADASTLATVVTLLAMVVGVVGNIVGGQLSDKLGRRKVFVVSSSLLFAIGIAILAFVTSLPMLYPIVAIIGLAQGVYTTVALALITQVLPTQHEAGKWLGIANISTTLPQSIAPAIAPMFLAINGPNNYTSLFLVSALLGVVGAVIAAIVRRSK